MAFACALVLIPGAADGQRRNVQPFTQAHGLPQSQVVALLQDSEGFVWVGTYGGIARLAGTSVQTFTTDHGLASNVVVAMAEDSDGAVHLGTLGGGLCSWSNGTFRCRTPRDGFPSSEVRTVLAEPGRLWAGTDAGVVLLSEGSQTVFGVDAGLPAPVVLALARDSEGTLWAGTRSGLARLEDDRFVVEHQGVVGVGPVNFLLPVADGVLAGSDSGLFLILPSRAAPISLPGVPAGTAFAHAALGEDGDVWVAASTGLFHLVEMSSDGALTLPARAELITAAQGLPREELRQVMVDREGTIWLGTDAGIAMLVPGPFLGFGEAEGLPSPFARAVAEDPEGRLWVGTRAGVARWDPVTERFQTVVPGSAFRDGRIYALAPAPEGGMLVGSRSGLLHWTPSGSRLYLPSDGLPAEYVLSLLPDGEGGVWIGTESGVARWREGVITPFPSGHPLADAFAVSLALDREGRTWVGLASGGVRVLSGTEVHSLSNENGLTDQVIWAMSEDANGAMWVGTNGSGAFRIQGDEIQRFTLADRLGNPFVWQVLPDSRGRVWLYTNQGLYRFQDGTFDHLRSGEGLLDMEGTAGAALEDRAGRLWFGTARGIQVYLPEEERRNETAPPARIESVSLGGVPVADGGEIRLAGNLLQIRFGALSFRAPWAVRYRYRLIRGDGPEPAWSEPFADPAMTFAGLPSGRYTFQALAINGDGVVSQTPATFTFTVLPTVWETWWFRLAALLVLLAVVLLVVNLRVRQTREDRKRLEAILKQRESRLKEIVENSTVMFYSHDTEHHITYISPQVETVLGVTPEEAARRWTEFATDHPINAEGEAITMEALRTGERQPPYELELRHSSGRPVRVQVVESPVLQDGKVVGMVGSLTDVTAATEAEAKRKELEERLQMTERMEAVGQLAGGIAHDFNNLLTSILGHVSLMEMELPPTHPLQEDLAEVHGACDRAAALVAQLLAFGRRQLVQPRPRNLDRDVESTLALLNRVLGDDIIVESHSSPREPWVLMDGSQVDQILLNLAVNARDAMPRGGKLTISTEVQRLDPVPADWNDPEMAPGDYVILRVEDTGMGIPAEAVHRIFEPFFTTKPLGEGSGLGLATVWGIVKQNGGHVQVRSEVGVKTVFEIYLPYHDGSGSASADGE